MSKLDAVRALHVQEDGNDDYCAGCEPGLYAASGIDWPCATARIVYSPKELAAAITDRQERHDTARAQRVAVREADRDAYIAEHGHPPAPSMLQQIYDRAIKSQLEAAQIWTRFEKIATDSADNSPNKTVTFGIHDSF